MSELKLHHAGTVVCGPGSLARLPELVAGVGVRRCLLVTTSTVRPLVDRLLDGFRMAGIEVREAPYVDREPRVSDYEAVAHFCDHVKPEFVIGIGGGSVLDIAKLVAALGGDARRIHEVFGHETISRRELGLVCVPTTAGTGSEASPNAILLDEGSQEKKAVISRYLLPDYVILDPELLITVPPQVTASTGMDALIHCIEAYTSRRAHPMIDEIALAGIRLLGKGLPRAVEDGRDLLARTQTLIGSYFGGMCLGPVGTAGVHALAYPLNGRFGIPHGVANAVMLPYVAHFNFEFVKDRYLKVLAELGCSDTSPHESGLGVMDKFRRLVAEIGLPTTLRELGVPESALPALAQSAIRISRLLVNNPRPISEADALYIYRMAF